MEKEWWKLKGNLLNFKDEQYPKMTVVIPTFNCSQVIAWTMESVLAQHYPDFEVLIIDASSTDRTVEIVNSFRSDRVKVYSLPKYNRYEMLNEGIARSCGTYLHFISPGDFYTSHDAYKLMMTMVLERDFPKLVFCGTLLREGYHDAKCLYRHLSLKLLRRGQQPTSLQSCWFHIDLFNELGRFDTKMSLRGGYDFFCRFALHGNLRAYSTHRVLTDYDLRLVTKQMVVRHFRETFKTIFHYFGLFSLVRWLFIQKDLRRILRLSWRSVKVALLGRQRVESL